MFKTVIAKHKVEQMEKVPFIFVSFKDVQRVLKIEIIIISAKIEAKLFKIVLMPEVR